MHVSKWPWSVQIEKLNTTSSFQYRHVRRGGVSAVSENLPEMHLLIIHKGKTRKVHGRSSPSTVLLNSSHKMPAWRTIFQYSLSKPLQHPYAPATNHSSKFVFSKILNRFMLSLIIYTHAEIYNDWLPITDGQFFAQISSLDKPKRLWLHPHVA